MTDLVLDFNSSCYSQKLDDTSAWEYNIATGSLVVSETAEISLTADSKFRSVCKPTLYQKLSKQNIDWCRYCGTTEGVNWRPGPWGKRTLCK